MMYCFESEIFQELIINIDYFKVKIISLTHTAHDDELNNNCCVQSVHVSGLRAFIEFIILSGTSRKGVILSEVIKFRVK